ncbi:ATP-binding protein [Streptomyces cyaneofuscatus]|uniref:ATP-binding protein n=1 Tax=Streptomyces cyaneofuscatus TaxID=66883 RepID=UPI0036521533
MPAQRATSDADTANRSDPPHCVSRCNALVHGTVSDHGFLVRLDAEDGVVRLEVHDSRCERPKTGEAADTDLSGRGLILVDALADDWGVQDRTPLGKIVWSSFKGAGGKQA